MNQVSGDQTATILPSLAPIYDEVHQFSGDQSQTTRKYVNFVGPSTLADYANTLTHQSDNIATEGHSLPITSVNPIATSDEGQPLGGVYACLDARVEPLPSVYARLETTTKL